MTSRERLLAALSHREPDRIPFDVGSTQVTGIAAGAYRALRRHLALPEREPVLCDTIQQLALPDDDFVEELGIDVRGLYPLSSHNAKIEHEDAGDAWAHTDEWGIGYRFPKEGGLYYEIVKSPLAAPETSPQEIAAHAWPRTGDPERIRGLRELALRYREAGKAVVLKGVLAGVFEMAQRIRGMRNCLIDLLADEASTCALFDKLLELKLRFWEMALPALADVIDVVAEADDYGAQASQLMSPDQFRRLVKPRLRVLFRRIEELAPAARIFFHSCGNVRPLIPDLIELGVDILNPVHVAAAGMDPAGLKRDFGEDLVFWGGGVDTQGVLPRGTPAAVRDHVRKNIEALAPGGGFVFAAVHNIQADVPPENVAAMVEALRER